MKRSYLLLLAKSLIYIIIIGIPLFYLKQSVYPYTFPKTLFFQFLVEILFLVWLPLAISDPRYRPKKTSLHIAGGVFLGILIVTSVLGVDFHRSFWSTYERMLGIFTFIHLAVFALIISALYREISWKKTLYFSLAAAAVVGALAILQKEQQAFWKKWFLDEPIGRPGATFGNPTFMAGYLTFNIIIGLYLLLDKWKNHKFDKGGRLSYIFIILAIGLSLTALFLSETRGDILGLGAGLFTLIFIFAFSPPEGFRHTYSRWFFIGLIIAIFVFGSTFWLTRQNSIWDSVPGLNRFRDVSFSISDLNTNLFPRLVAIRAAWSGFLERPVSGWGWDNFNIVYNKYYDPRTLEANYQETRFDKPHNFVLEDLVSGGALLFLAHFALFGFFVWEALKTQSLFSRFALGALAGYIIRNLFIFDTLGPALMFYMFVGLVDGKYREQNKEEIGSNNTNNQGNRKKQKDTEVGLSYYFLILMAVGTVIAYLINVPSVKAAYYEFLGFRAFHNNPTRGIEYFDKSLAESSPYRWNFVRDFATVVSEAYFYNPGAVKPEEVRRAIGEMERVARDHYLDAYNHYALVDMYNQISDIDLEGFLSSAERESKIALELSPNRQEVYFSMAKTKSLRSDYKGALGILKKALDLDPKVADAHFYYGLVLSANADLQAGYVELKKAISLGKSWKNYYEPRIVADYFADAGHIEEAIELYKTVLIMNSDDLEAKIKIGAAYFYIEDYPAARGYLSEVATKFDFTKSPVYGSIKPILDQLGIKAGE